MATPTPHAPDKGGSQAAAVVPLAIWPVAQTTAPSQRAGRYLPGSTAHPVTASPELARRIVTEYSRPGDLVVDPICGTGATLIEAAALDRRAIGIELEDRWARLAVANCEHILTAAQQARVEVITADARRLPDVLADRAGTVDLVVVSPPYGWDAQVINRPRRAGGRLPNTGTCHYGDAANLGHARGRTYLDIIGAIYAGCAAVLKPGGLLVTVTQNTRRGGRLLDLAGITVRLAQAAGFDYLQHVIALHAAIRDGDLAPRPSSGQLTATLNAHERGEPAHLVVHRDVLLFRTPTTAGGNGAAHA